MGLRQKQIIERRNQQLEELSKSLAAAEKQVERLTDVLTKDRRDIHTQRTIIGELQAEIERLQAVVDAVDNLMKQPRRNSNPRYGQAWERLASARAAVEDEVRCDVLTKDREIQKAFEYGYNSGHMDSCMLAWKEYCGVRE